MSLVFYQSATWIKRLINYIVDFIIIILAFIAIIMIVPVFLKVLVVEFTININAIFAILYLIYYLVFESTTGRTVGKYLTGTKVIGEGGKPPSFVQILVRTLMRLLIIELISYLSKRPDGWHDTASNTQVIDVKKLKDE